MSNTKRPKMTRVELEDLADAWRRAQDIEALAVAMASADTEQTQADDGQGE